MNRRALLWLARIDAGHPRATAQLATLQSAAAGLAGCAGGLAIALIVMRPLLALIPGWEGVWQ